MSEVADGVQPAIADWQRPEFEPGNTVAQVHGAFSPRVVDPLATELVEALLADGDVSYLRAPSYRLSLWAWARSEVQCQLLVEHVEQLGGLVEGLVETGTEESDETRDGGNLHRVSKSRRMGSALTALDRAERHAAMCRSRLGLDPLSRARLGRDVAAAKVDMAEVLSQLKEAADKQAAKQRQEDK